MGFSVHISLIVFSFLAIQLASISAADPLFTICSSASQNYTTNSPYQQNLNKVLGDLYCNTPSTGFGVASSGQNPDRVYGLSLCRADVRSDDCRACLVDAATQITKSCPNNRGAIVWYDNCYLKYLNSEFFGRIDNENRFYMWNLRNVSNPEAFNERIRDLLGKLSGDAIQTTRLFARGETWLGNVTIYGMAQCSRDLSGADCKRCVDGAISELPSCCDGREGGRVVGGSCNIRYEIYPFLNL